MYVSFVAEPSYTFSKDHLLIPSFRIVLLNGFISPVWLSLLNLRGSGTALNAYQCSKSNKSNLLIIAQESSITIIKVLIMHFYATFTISCDPKYSFLLDVLSFQNYLTILIISIYWWNPIGPSYPWPIQSHSPWYSFIVLPWTSCLAEPHVPPGSLGSPPAPQYGPRSWWKCWRESVRQGQRCKIGFMTGRIQFKQYDKVFF